MKYLRYSHELVRPLIGVWLAILQRFIAGRLLPLAGRLFPGPAGRRIIARIAYLLAIATQIVLVVVLAELVEISISIAELWTLLAQKHLEITL
ncbi:MAG TPA: hypothetical protein VFA32_13345 [Dehalococcoidia bacterium]|nr:hypothetical protein [Dehalococcoidia bacterium]